VRNYDFSEMSFRTLRECVDISQSLNYTEYEKEWFNYSKELSNSDIEFLENRSNKVKLFINAYNEQELITKFIAIILDRVDFYFIDSEVIENSIRDFWDTNLSYENIEKDFRFSGKFDFAVAKGDLYPEKPYFFLQEFKQSEGTNPRPQLLAEMVSAVELNSTDKIRGAFISGQYWTFVTLHKIKDNNYRYYFSNSYDSTDIQELKTVFAMLLFVKDEIKDFL
jgi:hypothetical protein